LRGEFYEEREEDFERYLIGNDAVFLEVAGALNGKRHPREWEVLRLIAQGVMLNQIAELLHLSPKTVTTHKTHLMEKLGIGNNADLIRYAIEHKLFD